MPRLTPHQIGQRLERLRPRITLVCAHCGATFAGLANHANATTGARYCSSNCRAHAWYASNKERAIEGQRQRRKDAKDKKETQRKQDQSQIPPTAP